MKYVVTLCMSRYMKVRAEGDKWETIEMTKAFTFDCWDDVQNFIGYMVEGGAGSIKLEIEAVKEPAKEE